MTRPSFSEINAYIDGILDEQQRQAFEQALGADPEAAAFLKQYREQVAELHRLYDGVMREPVPPRMLELLRKQRRPE